MSVDKTASYSAPALEKGLDIIELLSRQEIGLTQSEIARALGRTVSEIFRMLMVLKSRGYVSQDPVSDRYALTTFVFEIAHRIPTIGRLSAIAQPIMREMTRAIQQSAHLAILGEGGVLVVAQINSPGNNNMSVRLGSLIDTWRASSGRVIIAFSDEETVDRLLRDEPLPPGTTRALIREELAQIRAAGHEVRDSFVIRGIVNISTPVLDHSGQAIAALTVPHIERLQDGVPFETCRRAVIDAAGRISRSLGWSADEPA